MLPIGTKVTFRYRSLLNGQEGYGEGIIEKDLGDKYEISLLRPKLNAKLLVTPEEICSMSFKQTYGEDNSRG